MREYIASWLIFLRDTDAAFGIPLILVGLMLMFMGGPLNRMSIPFIYVLLGLVGGRLFLQGLGNQLLFGALAGVVLAIISYLVQRGAVCLLGGVCAAFAVTAYFDHLESMRMMPMAGTIGVAALSFLGGAALSFIMFKEMAIAVTSFAGTLLLVSGLSATLPTMAPSIYSTVGSFLVDYPGLLVPLMVGAPTAMGVLVQLANANREQSGVA